MPDQQQPAVSAGAKKARRRAKKQPATGAAPRGHSTVDAFLLAQGAQTDEQPQEPPSDPLAGYSEPDPLATAWTELDLRCPRCNITHYVPTCTFLNAEESPHLLERLARGQFNLKRCPLCRAVEPVDYPYTVYLPQRKLAVQVRAEWEYHAGGGEEWYAARLEDFFERWAAHDVRIDVVFSPATFLERYADDVQAVVGAQVSAERPDPPVR